MSQYQFPYREVNRSTDKKLRDRLFVYLQYLDQIDSDFDMTGFPDSQSYGLSNDTKYVNIIDGFLIDDPTNRCFSILDSISGISRLILRSVSSE